jgi:hypothetical protein
MVMRVNFKSAGIPLAAVTSAIGWVCHGEDIATGTKSFYQKLGDASGSGASAILADPASPVVAGGDVGALGTYPTNWRWASIPQTIDVGVRAVERYALWKNSGGTRVLSVCFMGVYVEYTPPSVSLAPFRAFPRSILNH